MVLVTFVLRQAGDLFGLADGAATTKKYLIANPKGAGDVTVNVIDGFLDSTLEIQLHDYTAPSAKPIAINLSSNATGQGTWPKEMFWSGDSSLFVLADESYYYDFKTHRETINYYPAKAKTFWSKEFKALLASRGGKGHKVAPES